MKSPVQRDIDGRLYEFFYMSPKTSIRVLTRLAKLVGEPLGAVADAVLKGGKDGKVSVQSFLNSDMATLPPDLINNAVKSLMERIDEREILETIEQVIEKIHVQGEGDKGTRPIRFETDFAGRILHLFKVVKAALEVNYSDFLGESTGLAGAVMSASRTTSG